MIKEKIFFLKNYFFRRKALEKYKKIKEYDSLDFQDMEKINFQKRKIIVLNAYNNSKFYKKFYDANNFHPSCLKSERDWEKIPILSKELIRKNEKEIFISDNNKSHFLVSTTGGSTGEPLRVYHDKRNYQETYGWKVFDWWGVEKGSNIAFIFRLTRSGIVNKLINKIIWFPTNRIFLDVSSSTYIDFDRFILKIKKNKPKIIQGYTGALNEFALYCYSLQITFTFVKAIWCTSSPLTSTIKNNIAKVFNADIYDQYGSGEVFWIATECRQHNGLHIHTDSRHIDIVDKNGISLPKGKMGRILITDLDNQLFPIIKYENGDLSSINPTYCKCGLPYPLLNKINGRVSSSIKLPSGGFIAGDYFTTIFDEYVDFVSKFQIKQLENYSLEIYVVLKDNTKDKFLEEIEKRLYVKTKNLISINFILVKALQNTRNGKNQFIISEVV